MAALPRPLATHPYRGLTAAIATRHGKGAAIGPVLADWFGIALKTVASVDTDALGTFTGETPRRGSMLDAARAKARAAIKRAGTPLGLGSEGAFGPDPLFPFLACGEEAIVLREARSGHEIVVHRRTPTNFGHLVVAPGADIADFLDAAGFPAHALVVRPENLGDVSNIVKAIADPQALQAAIGFVAARSPTGKVTIQTDMRAHLNPTRMAAIRRTARWLALRAARCCPSCGRPGFGVADVERGLPCRRCRAPTALVRAELYRCARCGYQEPRRVRAPHRTADPAWCPCCNP